MPNIPPCTLHPSTFPCTQLSDAEANPVTSTLPLVAPGHVGKFSLLLATPRRSWAPSLVIASGYALSPVVFFFFFPGADIALLIPPKCETTLESDQST
jgi:hypothetical protein